MYTIYDCVLYHVASRAREVQHRLRLRPNNDALLLYNDIILYNDIASRAREVQHRLRLRPRIRCVAIAAYNLYNNDNNMHDMFPPL
jgi:hypothetical protein